MFHFLTYRLETFLLRKCLREGGAWLILLKVHESSRWFLCGWRLRPAISLGAVYFSEGCPPLIIAPTGAMETEKVKSILSIKNIFAGKCARKICNLVRLLARFFMALFGLDDRIF